MGLASTAEYLNGLAARNWRLFSTQNYFDERGIFASALFSAPLLLTAFVILLMTLKSAAGLLVTAKRAELKFKSAQKFECDSTATSVNRTVD